MVDPLVRDGVLFGVLPAAVVVVLVYVGSTVVGSPFAPLALGMLLVGLMLGSMMFARTGTGTGTAVGGEGRSESDISGDTEPSATHYVVTGSDTPLKFRAGVFLLALALFSAVGLAVVL